MKPIYRSTLLIMAIFILDVILGNASRIMGKAETMEEWTRQVILYNTLKSFLDWTPYILLMIISRVKLDFDWMDQAMALVCLFSCIVNSADWIMNFNFRPVILDWWAFGSMLLVLVGLKINRYR